MKILAQRPTHVSAVAIVLLITKIFTVKYYDRRIYKNRTSIIIINETATATEMIPKNKTKQKSGEKQLDRKGKQTKIKQTKNILGHLQKAGAERETQRDTERQRQTVSK